MAVTYLFVYGTLRNGYGLPLSNALSGKWLWEGEGKVKAALFDLGPYPAAVRGTGAEELTGDVYRLPKAQQVLPVLDSYEGEEYRREMVKVEMVSGAELKAWIYWYTGTVDGCHRVTENDYLDYLNNKKDRFV